MKHRLYSVHNMNRIHYIHRVLSSVKSISECSALYHIAERRAKRYEKELKYLEAKHEWFFSEKLRKSILSVGDKGHTKAIEYCIKKQKKLNENIKIEIEKNYDKEYNVYLL